jgi:hypothetical protein
LTSVGSEEDKEFGKCLEAARRDPEFSNCEKLPVALWCNGATLDVISLCFDVTICVFGSCFEKRGYILKAVHRAPIEHSADPERFIAIHHEGVAFNPLISRGDEYTR